MPKTKTDYSKTLIYKIVCKDLEIKDCYVGHTVNFTKRKSQHKSDCNNQNKKYNSNVYKFIRQNGGWDNWDMIQIKKYPCNDKREAEAEERKIYEELNSNLNTNRPFITNDEKKNYYEENKDKMKDYKKNYIKENEDKIKDYKQNYYEENKDKIKDYNKNYYQENKDKVLADMNQKVKCECGALISKCNLNRHLKTKKHQNYINNL